MKCHKAYKRIKNFLRSNATQLYKDDDDHLLGDDDASRQRVGHGTSMTRDKSLLHFSVLLCYALQMSCAEGVNYVFEKCYIKERVSLYDLFCRSSYLCLATALFSTF